MDLRESEPSVLTSQCPGIHPNTSIGLIIPIFQATMAGLVNLLSYYGLVIPTAANLYESNSQTAP